MLADTHGTVLHLGERECSLQRRHQKVVEEAPSALLSAAERDRYGAIAVEAARSVGYTGAGTVEFIVSADAPDEPFFMEMNTRLQVEHPVTELVTGLDLVEQQLRVAAGEPLAFGQADVPSPVTLSRCACTPRTRRAASCRPAARRCCCASRPATASGSTARCVEGAPVGTTYDPMLSKVIAWGPDRTTALARLDRALADTVVLGVGTNTAFLRRLLRHDDVRAGRLDTGLVERELDGARRRRGAAGRAGGLRADPAGRRCAPATTRGQQPTGWRPGRAAALRWDLDVAGQRQALTLSGDVLTWDGVTAPVALDGALLTVDGRTLPLLVAQDGDTTWVHVDGGTYALTPLPPVRRGGAAGSADASVRSPMPGAVLAVHVADGDAVEKGTPLLVVEAMKMEHTLVAPTAGTAEVRVRVGDQVVVDQELALVHPGPGMSTPIAGLPARVEVYEVGPRDGLQNEATAVPVEVKAEFVRRLVASGLRTVELTSFVPKRWIPQLGDAEELMALLGEDQPPRAPVLVPNEKGLERALATGAREIAVFAAATEAFAKRNLNRTVAESLEMFRPVVEGARAAGLPVRGYVSMCFGDPWEGAVPLEQVADVAGALRDMGCTEVSLGDTIGVGTPGQVVALLDLLGVARPAGRRRRRALPRHLRPGARQHPGRAAARGHDRGRQRRRPRRLPLRRQRHRQPVDRGPRVPAARPRHRDRRRPALARPHQRSGWPRARPPVVVPHRDRTRIDVQED